MKSIVLALAAGTGILMVPAMQASAAPANGAAVVNGQQQVDTVIAAASKRNKTGRCRADFVRDRAGYCVPSTRY
jgi:hypothetical protein